jgi:hypothetical protein
LKALRDLPKREELVSAEAAAPLLSAAERVTEPEEAEVAPEVAPGVAPEAGEDSPAESAPAKAGEG